MAKIVIVDLGTGNLRSVSKALAFVSDGANVSVTADPHTIENAAYLVLPGQGALGTWFNRLNDDAELKMAVSNRLNDGPVLGICLGLQALYNHSEEHGGTPGLDLLAGCVKHFSAHPHHQYRQQLRQSEDNSRVDNRSEKLKIPHMGWNQVTQCANHPLWHGINNEERFYFVHSYYVESAIQSQVMGECQYGNQFTAAAGLRNIFATQFHPEKSQQSGLQLLKNFVNWNGVF